MYISRRRSRSDKSAQLAGAARWRRCARGSTSPQATRRTKPSSLWCSLATKQETSDTWSVRPVLWEGSRREAAPFPMTIERQNIGDRRSSNLAMAYELKSYYMVDVLLALGLSGRRFRGKGEDSFCKTATSRREDELCGVHVAVMDRCALRADPLSYSKTCDTFGAAACAAR